MAFVISPTRKSKILIFIVSAIVFEYQIIRDSIHFYTKLFHIIVEICESDDTLKTNYIFDQGQSVDEKLVIAVFREIRPAFVQTVNIIMKTVIVMLIYASALTFVLKFNDRMSDAIERLSILLTSVTPIILQWKYKKVCPTKKRVEIIIFEYPRKAEQKATKAIEIADESVQKAHKHTTEASKHATTALQHTEEAKNKLKMLRNMLQKLNEMLKKLNKMLNKEMLKKLSVMLKKLSIMLSKLKEMRKRLKKMRKKLN